MKTKFTFLVMLVIFGLSKVLNAQTVWLASDTAWGYRTDKNYVLLNYSPDQSWMGLDGDLTSTYLQNSWIVGDNNDVWHLEASFYYDLQQPTTLDAFKFYGESGYPYHSVDSFQLYYSNDSVNWSLAINQTMSESYSMDWYSYNFASQTARFWKLTAMPKDKAFEIKEIAFGSSCSSYLIYDTVSYFVSSLAFESISPKTVFETTDSLTTQIGGCDSIVHHYSEYIFDANHCTDTIEVFDTTYVTVYDSISVTDTLIIDAVLTGVNPPNNINTIKIYPNPAKTHIYINNGDYNSMNGYSVRIDNSLGQIVYNHLIDQQEFYINLSGWTGNGTYFVYIIDDSSNIIEVKKIIIQ